MSKDLKRQIKAELAQLKIKVGSYSSRKLSKLKRMGLPKIKRSMLVQNYYYLEGLCKYNLGSAGEIATFESFLKSIRCCRHQVNGVSKKAFLKMNQILQTKKNQLLQLNIAKDDVQL